jgi:hypothetical protein
MLLKEQYSSLNVSLYVYDPNIFNVYNLQELKDKDKKIEIESNGITAYRLYIALGKFQNCIQICSNCSCHPQCHNCDCGRGYKLLGPDFTDYDKYVDILHAGDEISIGGLVFVLDEDYVDPRTRPYYIEKAKQKRNIETLKRKQIELEEELNQAQKKYRAL